MSNANRHVYELIVEFSRRGGENSRVFVEDAVFWEMIAEYRAWYGPISESAYGTFRFCGIHILPFGGVHV